MRAEEHWEGTPDSDVLFPIGAEGEDAHGNRWVVVGVHANYLGLKRSTWWRRLICRFRRWFS